MSKIRSGLCLALVAAIAAFTYPAAAQSVRYVDRNVVGGLNDGSSWANAYASLWTAVTAATTPAGTGWGALESQLWVADGQYPDPNGSPTMANINKNYLAIYGGFQGPGDTSLSARDWLTYPSTITGDKNLDTVQNDARTVPLFGTTGAINFALDGFTVELSQGSSRGALYTGLAAGDKFVRHCIFRNNTGSGIATMGGGAINHLSNRLYVENSLFYNNTANTTTAGGGAIFVRTQATGHLYVTNCTFVANSAPGSGIGGDDIAAQSANYLNIYGSILRSSATPISNLGVGTRHCNYNNSTVNLNPYGANNNTAAPVFVGGSDYRLDGSDTACLDTGPATGHPPDDLNGVVRPQGSNLDRGAYERVSALPPPAPTVVDASDGQFDTKTVVTWDSVPAATSYKLYRSTDAAHSGEVEVDTGILVTTYDDTTGTPDVPYYYWVKANNANGDSAYSPFDIGYRVSVLSPPAQAPDNVSATDNNITDPSKVVVTWDALLGADDYDVYRNTVNNFGTATLLGNTAATSYDDTGATVDYRSPNYFWVVAKNAAGDGPEGTPNTGYRYDVTRPLLWWRHSEGSGTTTADASGNGHTGTLGGTVSFVPAGGPTLSGSGVTLDAADYAASGYTANSISTPSFTFNYAKGSVLFWANPDSITTRWTWLEHTNGAVQIAKNTLGIYPYNNGGADGESYGSIPTAGSWQHFAYTWNTTGVGRNWYKNGVIDGTGPWPDTATLYAGPNQTESLHTGHDAGFGSSIRDYDGKMADFVIYGSELSPATIASVISDGPHSLAVTIPDPATALTATDGAFADRTELSWTAPTTWPVPLEYDVYRHTADNSGLASVIATTTDTSYDDTTGAPGTHYWYWVKAVNNAGESAFSNSDEGWRLSAVPDLSGDTPTGLTASDDAFYDKVVLNWDDLFGADSYEVYRNTVNNSGTATLINSPVASAYDDTSAVQGQTYYYWVKGVNSLPSTSQFSAPDTGSAVVPLDMIVWYKFDEGAGTTAADSSLHGYAGTLGSSVSFQPGQGPTLPGSLVTLDAVLFAANSESQSRVTTPAVTFPGAQGTIVFWFKPTSNPNRYYLVDTSTAKPEIGKNSLGLYPKADSADTEVYGTPPGVGVWQHLAFTWDDVANERILYANAAINGAYPATTLPADNGPQTWWLGVDQSTAGRQFPGYMADFAIYPTALTQPEIDVIMNYGVNGSAPVPLPDQTIMNFK